MSDNSSSNNNNNSSNNNNNNAEDWTIQRDAFKSLGDNAFRSGHYALAIQHYTQALSVDPDSAVLYSNRSAAFLKDNQKSRALHDAEACVKIGSMGSKGIGRLAAALQALGRWQPALDQWQAVLKEDTANQAAKQGVADCEKALERIKEQSPVEENTDSQKLPAEEDEKDELDDFFNQVEEVTVAVKKEKELAAQPVATNAIQSQKKDLGTAQQNIERLLQDNYKWKNLNPFHVLQISHTATKDEINKRYKALSLLLHPDKNATKDNADTIQQAYDEVQKAKELLDDDDRANHARQLVEQGMLQGQYDWDKRRKDLQSQDDSLESFREKAIFKIFAQVEYSRRDVERRQRAQEQRERQQEEELLQKEREERQFDKNWKQEERVEKRLGSWRDFSKKKKSKL